MKITIEKAIGILKEGGIVAFPTETVYGLGACAFDAKAAAEVFRLKGRPADNPLIIHISSLKQVEALAVDIPPAFYLLAAHFFPGPLTVVLKKHPQVPEIVCAGLDTVAIRMPAHPIAQELIRGVGLPIAAPSANLSGKPSATEAYHVSEDFPHLPLIDGGETILGIESTVLSLIPEPILLRPGTLPKKEIESVLRTRVRDKQPSDQASSPGMKHRHYTPDVPLKLFTDPLEFQKAHNPAHKQLILKEISTHSLYKHLRNKEIEEILIFCDEQTLSDPALMDRLTRAAGEVFSQ